MHSRVRLHVMRQILVGFSTLTISLAILAVTADAQETVHVTAQDNAGTKAGHHHYLLVDLGTLGGPDSIIFGETGPLNNRGIVSSCATTSVPDPNYPNINPYFSAPGDSHIQHAFMWRDGVLSDLGTLAGGTSSCEQWISDTGFIVGGSTNGLIDSQLGVPEVHATFWLGEKPFDLGTLGGSESVAYAVNNFGEVAGVASNNIADSNASNFLASATQVHAAIWRNGAIQDLQTLGEGTDSIAYLNNDRGQVAGQSFTNNTINSTTGMPTMDIFLWENDQMFDLGTLGGVRSFAIALNNRGQVAGYSDLSGDIAYHPVLGDRTGMKDLGTLGGTLGQANWLNDSAEVVGWATTQGDQAKDAFLWRNGLMTDLKTLAGDSDSVARGINAGGQVVGQSYSSETGHAFLWENGGPMVNLQNLVLPGSDLALLEATFINDRGEIVGNGLLPNGDQHAVLLIPCDESHRGVEGCDYSMVDGSDRQATQMATTAKPVLSPDSIRQLMQSTGRRSKPWYRGFEPQTQPK